MTYPWDGKPLAAIIIVHASFCEHESHEISKDYIYKIYDVLRCFQTAVQTNRLVSNSSLGSHETFQPRILVRKGKYMRHIEA